MEAIAGAIKDIAARPDVAIIFPVHPNPNVRAVMDSALAGLDNVAMIDPLDYPHFVRLLDMAEIVLTDSGGVQEEAPSLGKPVLVMRETTERPEGIAAGTAKLVGTDRTRIVTEMFRLLDDSDRLFRHGESAQSVRRRHGGNADCKDHRPCPPDAELNVAVIGLGYIGLPTAALIARSGAKVLGVDVSAHVVDTINSGKCISRRSISTGWCRAWSRAAPCAPPSRSSPPTCSSSPCRPR
jgi:hypothetical protein